MSKMYDVCIGNKYTDKATGEEKTRWTRIGVAFLNDDGEKIGIQLDAMPIGNGNLQAFAKKPKEPSN